MEHPPPSFASTLLNRMEKPAEHTNQHTGWIFAVSVVAPFLAIVAGMLLCIKFCKRKPPDLGLGGDLWRR